MSSTITTTTAARRAARSTGNINNRTTNDSTWRARGYVTLDARNQTPYGTVRAYMDVGFISDTVGGSGGISAHTNRGFIQWAGFTFGQAVSFFDFYSFPAMQYIAAGHPGAETGGGGWFVAGYTAQFGNGFSGTIAAEMRRQTQIIGQGFTPAFVTNGTIAPGSIGPGAGYAGFQSPDIVANLRVDQAWGSAQIMGALHQVSTTYYDFNTVQPFDADGHPGDQWGFAIGGGIKLNVPMTGQGDYFSAEVNYTQGALGYVFSPQISDFNWYGRHGQNAGYGILSDAVYGGTMDQGNTTSSAADHGLGRQRRLRAPLESAVEDVGLRRLCRSQLRQPGQRDAVRAARRRQRHRRRHHRGGDRRLQQRLERLVCRLAYPVERHQGLLHGR